MGKSLETLPREVVQKPPRQKNVSRQDLFEFRLISRNSKYLDGGTRSEHLACSLWFPCHGNLPAKRHRDEHCGPPIDVADLPTKKHRDEHCGPPTPCITNFRFRPQPAPLTPTSNVDVGMCGRATGEFFFLVPCFRGGAAQHCFGGEGAGHQAGHLKLRSARGGWALQP